MHLRPGTERIERVGGLHNFMNFKKPEFLVVNVDVDLYTATLFILTHLKYHIPKNNIFIFDEFATGIHEFRAFKDFIDSYNKSSSNDTKVSEPLICIDEVESSKLNKSIFHHIGVYGFQKQFLKEYVSQTPSKRELEEKLEQLRVSENTKISITVIDEEILGVDTKEDLDTVNQLIQDHG